ncbi:hypothetical protein [Kitasatospora paranensis]|uniref:hypothetical protein n=1 Tax=Kitasatospora paranensis TaxID=258053 RepID=UPI0031E5D6B7
MPATPGGRLLAATAVRLRTRLVLLAVALGIQVGAGLALPVLLARAVDAVLRHGDTLGPVAALAAALAAGAIGETAMLQLSVSTGAHGTAWIRMRTVRRLLGLGPRSPFPAGEAVTQVVQAAPRRPTCPPRRSNPPSRPSGRPWHWSRCGPSTGGPAWSSPCCSRSPPWWPAGSSPRPAMPRPATWPPRPAWRPCW